MNTLLATIDVDKSNTECTQVEEETYVEEEGGAQLESPFVVKKRKKRTSTGQCKKQKSNKKIGTMPLVLTEGDLDEIGDVVRDARMDLMNHFEVQCQ